MNKEHTAHLYTVEHYSLINTHEIMPFVENG
jgi:hypothetical protein